MCWRKERYKGEQKIKYVVAILLLIALYLNNYFAEGVKQDNYIKSIEEIEVDKNTGYEFWHEIEEPDGITIEFLIKREVVLRLKGGDFNE